MLVIAAWILFALGIAHIPFGFFRFKTPMQEAIAEGFVGKFAGDDRRRLGFWFIAVGPLIAMAGHVALHALSAGDLGLIRIIGFYLLGLSIVGVLAFPKSPLWSTLVLSPIFIAGGYGWVS